MGPLAAAAGPPTLLSQRFFREKVKWVRKKRKPRNLRNNEVSRSLLTKIVSAAMNDTGYIQIFCVKNYIDERIFASFA